MTAAINRVALAASVWMTSLAVFSSSASAQDVTSFLIGHWPLVETSGAIAADLASPAHNGAYSGGVTLANSAPVPYSGAIAAQFDGVDDCVLIGSESSFDFSDYLSVAAWVKVDFFDVPNQDIITKGNSAWRLHRNGSSNGVAFTCTGMSNPTVGSVTNINDGKWHHIVGIRLGNQLQLYSTAC